MEPINVLDYETLAQSRLAPPIWDYYQGGSDDEITLRACRTAFEHILLRPRMLIDVNTITMSTTVLGTSISMPIMVAPTAFHALAHPAGECETAYGAGLAATLMVGSTFATRSIEEIMEVATGPLWQQIYIYRDQHVMADIVQRAEAAGYRALVLTADTPRLGRRERDIRNKFMISSYTTLANFSGEVVQTALPQPIVATWEMVDWLQSLTSLPVLLKGILTAEDALLAVEHGIKGIIVSNHGGRQLDGAIPGIIALPEIVDAVGEDCEVYLDGGIRRGTDVLKALALGARAVLVGRPVLWGLAVNARQGVQHILEILRSELELAMVLSGCPSLASISRSLVRFTV